MFMTNKKYDYKEGEPMESKYLKLYNRQTENISDYIIFKEDERNYYSILPITYYWLKKLNKLEIGPSLATAYDKVFFDRIGLSVNPERFEERYEKQYDSYYNELVIHEAQLKKLDDIGRFIEHLEYNRNHPILERLHKSIPTYKLTNQAYIEALGPVVHQLINKELMVEDTEGIKEKYQPILHAFQEYINIK